MVNTGLREFELVQLANLMPASLDEAKQLIPSLNDGPVDDDQLQRILDDLSTLGKYESI